MEYDSGRHCRLLRGGSSGGSLRSGNRIAEAVRGPRDIWAEGKTKVLGATRLHWADRRVSVAVPDSLSDGEWPESACAVKRRRFPVGARPTRRFAPAGSNRSSHGGNEMAEAFDWRSQLVTARMCRLQRE